MLTAVIVLSPEGPDLVVSRVVVDTEATGIAVWDADGAGGARPSRRGYASLDDALVQNSRATTTAIRIDVGSLDDAENLLGKPPPKSLSM